MSAMIVSNDTLKAAIINGDDNFVLSYLYKNALPKVRNYIINNNGSKEEADDIFQDSVLILYKKIKSGEVIEVDTLEGFVYFVSRNLWVNRVKKKNRITNIGVDYDIENSDQNALDEILSGEKNNAFAQLFELVGEKCKMLLIMAIYNKQSMEEIAEKMQFTSANAAKTHHYRCKQKLVELVENDVILKSLLKS